VAEGDQSVVVKRGGRFAFFLVTLLMLALAAVVLYLASTINHGKYRLTFVDGTLVVERGRLLPIGFEAFVPEAEALRGAYAPIQVPPGETARATEVFDDRADLDRGLYMTLSGWARSRLDAVAPEEFDLAVVYVQRAELLPGLSEEQRLELRTLRADLALRRGKRIVADAMSSLEWARREFKTAIELGAGRAGEAERWLAEVDRRVAILRELTPAAPPSEAPPPQAAPHRDVPDVEPPRWRL
jgi:hypothetical protein